MIDEGVTGPEGHEMCRPEHVEAEATQDRFFFSEISPCLSRKFLMILLNFNS